MIDRIDAAARSRNMARIRSKDTAPERYVRSTLFGAGFRFRLHSKNLPGSPDLVLSKYRTAVFVHGCFWHGHDCKKGRLRPATNTEKWNMKLDRNIARDQEVITSLRELGWRVFVIWSCQLQGDTDRLVRELADKNN